MWMILSASAAWLAGCVVLAWKRPGWAMGLLALTAGGPAAAGAILAETRYDLPHGPILIITGILLFLLTVILVFVKRQSNYDDEPWYKIVSRICLHIIIALLYLALLIVIFRPFGAILFVMTVVLWFRFRQTRRYSLALNVLSTISAAMRQNLPLPMALETAEIGRASCRERV